MRATASFRWEESEAVMGEMDIQQWKRPSIHRGINLGENNACRKY